MHRLLPLFALFFLLAPPVHAQYGQDLSGRPIPTLWPADTRFAVLFFIATDCPVSNRYAPEIRRLAQQFAPQPIAFWLVYPNRTETLPIIRTHLTAFYPGTPPAYILTHPSADLLRRTAARLTPEAALLSPSATLYTGRIDDRYLSIGTERPEATRHDLEDALTAALAGRPVPAPGGPPVGCGIVSTQ